VVYINTGGHDAHHGARAEHGRSRGNLNLQWDCVSFWRLHDQGYMDPCLRQARPQDSRISSFITPFLDPLCLVYAAGPWPSLVRQDVHFWLENAALRGRPVRWPPGTQGLANYILRIRGPFPNRDIFWRDIGEKLFRGCRETVDAEREIGGVVGKPNVEPRRKGSPQR
jgi:hypothetical protein